MLDLKSYLDALLPGQLSRIWDFKIDSSIHAIAIAPMRGIRRFLSKMGMANSESSVWVQINRRGHNCRPAAGYLAA
jgi:hypothetical protein